MSRRAILKTDTDLDGLKTIQETAKYLRTLSELEDELHEVDMKRVIVDSDLTAAVESTANDLAKRLEEMDEETKDLENKLKGQFDDFKDIKYQLAAAFVHRGNHAGGHYWICIRDFESGKWRKYNDETVEDANVNDILAPTQWMQGTPTFAVYVRTGEGKEYLQPVCREVAAQSAFDWSDDAPMADNIASQEVSEVPNGGTIDPRLTTQESEASAWDTPRDLPQGVKW